MEYVESDLKKLIQLDQRSQFSEEHLILVLYNLLTALKKLHQANVIHRDLKPANILIKEDCSVRICDFGISRTLPESLIGQGSGNSKRVRDSIIKKNLKSKMSEHNLKNMISEKCLKSQSEMKQKKRSISSHIGSRWYRAPEIILL